MARILVPEHKTVTGIYNAEQEILILTKTFHYFNHTL